MFVFIILWVRAEPSWMSFPLPFQYVISIGMLLAQPRKFLYFSKLEITVDIMFDEDCLIVF